MMFQFLQYLLQWLRVAQGGGTDPDGRQGLDAGPRIDPEG